MNRTINGIAIEFCPFCGSYNVAVRNKLTNKTKIFDTYNHYVYCTECNARGSYKDTIDAAVEIWNSTAMR